MIVPVVLSGGSGTRLWPLSRKQRPKQLLPMVSNRSMLGDTIARTRGLADLGEPLVVCNAEHHGAVSRELAAFGHGPERIVLEPVGRNTAPAVAAAALVVAATDGDDALLLVLPADHVITVAEAFRDAVVAGVDHATSGALVTFGIVPTRPETGYGYIRTGDRIGTTGRHIDRFVEKPDAATAAGYLAEGRYLWNSGMFLLGARTYLDELGRHRPEMLAAAERAVAGAHRDDGLWLDSAAFASSPSDSIDYAVMEHTTSGVVVPLDAGWNDVGSWEALHDVSHQDPDANTFVGDVSAIDTHGSYVRADDRLVAAIGLDNMVVVDTPDAVLIAPIGRSQDVKRMVELLEKTARPEAASSVVHDAAWGTIRRLGMVGAACVDAAAIDPSSAAVLPEGRSAIVTAGELTVGNTPVATGGWFTTTADHVHAGADGATVILVSTEETD